MRIANAERIAEQFVRVVKLKHRNYIAECGRSPNRLIVCYEIWYQVISAVRATSGHSVTSTTFDNMQVIFGDTVEEPILFWIPEDK